GGGVEDAVAAGGEGAADGGAGVPGPEGRAVGFVDGEDVAGEGAEVEDVAGAVGGRGGGVAGERDVPAVDGDEAGGVGANDDGAVGGDGGGGEGRADCRNGSRGRGGGRRAQRTRKCECVDRPCRNGRQDDLIAPDCWGIQVVRRFGGDLWSSRPADAVEF